MMYTYEGLYYRITSNNTKSIDIIIIERFQFLGCQIDSRPAEKKRKCGIVSDVVSTLFVCSKPYRHSAGGQCRM
jgi:hypothetical protein